MTKHIPVLLEEAVDNLNLAPNSVVVDCTLGEGGHARRILKELGPDGIYIGIDADQAAIDKQKDLITDSKADVRLVCDNFANLHQIIADQVVTPTAILADLGWRTDQFEDSGKGFSFNQDDPLIMTFGDPEKHLFTAADIVNDWEESSIADVIYGYGEERSSRRIAKAIVEARKEAPIKTAKQLAEIVEQSLPAIAKRGRIHPATKTFQALRIAVNDELGVLKTLMQDGFEALVPQGRLAIISFHSLEDRLVKTFFNSLSHDHKANKITKKPITANRTEIADNPRSRSAKLRVIEKI